VGNAGNITAYWRGYTEYHRDGLTDTLPRMLGTQAAGAAPLVLLTPACGARLARRAQGQERATQLLIVGGSLGGCAAALAACEAGLQVILTEETDWIGGQLTAQAVPPDENQWIESYGGTRRYQALRQAMRDTIRARPTLNTSARRNATLNPGNGWVSRICVEPRVALAALEAQLAPHVASGRLTILRRHVAIAADVEGTRVRSVRVRDLEMGRVAAASSATSSVASSSRVPRLRVQYAHVHPRLKVGDLTPATGALASTSALSCMSCSDLHVCCLRFDGMFLWSLRRTIDAFSFLCNGRRALSV
jgi:hypothetical protein